MHSAKGNMKALLFSVLILSICSCGLTAESAGFFKDPAHPGKCVFENLVLSAGEEAKLPKSCGRIMCGQESFATIQTCGVMVPPSGCKYGDYINIDAPYGKCCNKELIC